MTPDGTVTFEGVSRLATHPTGTLRVTYYDTGFLDLGDGVPIQYKGHESDSLIPEIFLRKKTGTSVFIPFANIDDANSQKARVFKKCCEAVLRNFFAAINDGNLEVRIDFSEGELFPEEYVFECNQDKIEDAFAKRFFYNPSYDNVRTNYFDKFNPHPYWLAYRNNDVTITDEYSQEEAIGLCAGKKYICFKRIYRFSVILLCS